MAAKIKLSKDKNILKKLNLVTVAYSNVERDMFPTKEAYEAEVEVEERAKDVVKVLIDLGVPAKGVPGDQYFLTCLLVDRPNLVLNLVDTLRGKDELQSSVPAALELASVQYTGAGLAGLVIGNDRNLTKRLMVAYDIPTPNFQFVRRAGTELDSELKYPCIVKLNESGGSVGIDNKAVKETEKEVNKRVDDLISTYKLPVIVEEFIDGPEITVIVFDDGAKRHVAMGEKVFKSKADGKHEFTSLESYRDLDAYKYKPVDDALYDRISKLAIKAFHGLHHEDYAKFDVRVDNETGTPYFTDSNPNTAFGPDMGLPMTEVMAMHGVSFEDMLISLLGKYAKQL